MHHKTVHIAERMILLSPLFVAFLWMGYLVINASSPANESFAPSLVGGLVSALFTFIVGYAIVLAVLFSMMSRSAKRATLIGMKKGE